MNFPPEFDKKVNMEKVSLPVIKRWIAERILDILGFEDDILVQFVFNMLESAKKQRSSPDPKLIQIQITGFLERDARTFTEELRQHLVSASRNPGGIPTSMLEETKRKLARRSKTGSSRRRREEEEADEEKRKLEEAREKALEQSKAIGEEKGEQSAQVREMLNNIKKKQREQDEMKQKKRTIPRSLADCFSSSIVAKAKQQEEQQRRIELKRIRAMEERLKAERAERKRRIEEEEEKETALKAADAEKQRSSLERPTMETEKQRSRSRSRKRRRSPSPSTQRESTPSTSPSPPREWLKKKKRRKKSSRRRRSSSSSDSND